MQVSWQPTDESLEQALVSLKDAQFSYEEVGATQGVLPAGYRHVTRSHRIGEGEEVFDRAVNGLFGWEMHRRAGFSVHATAPSAEVGTTVLLVKRNGPIAFLNPCRVVQTFTEGRQQGFVYGTLSGHLEIGEECFIVRMGDDGQVEFQMVIFSRPATAWFRGRFASWLQDQFNHRYVASLRRLAKADSVDVDPAQPDQDP